MSPQDSVPAAGDPVAVGGEGGRPGPVRRVARRVLAGAWEDDIFSESANAGFWQTLSLPPLLLGLFGILGFVGDWFGPDTVTAVQEYIVQTTGGFFSRNAVEEIIAPTVGDILTTARGEVVSLGFVLSLWSGSSAMAAFVDAITRAHGQYELRNLVWQRLLSILLYTVALVFGIIALPIVAIGPDRLLPLVPDQFRSAAEAVVATLTTPVLGVVLVLALTTLYRIALPYKPPWWRGLPGALLAAVVFLVGVTGLRAYLDWITSTGYTYGALAAPIAFLLATFFIALAIVIGAHVNAAIQAEWPAVLRRRGQIVARQQPEGATPSGRPHGVVDAVQRDPEAAAALLAGMGYRIERPEDVEPAEVVVEDGPRDGTDDTDGGAEDSAAEVDDTRPEPEADQDHAPPDMAAERAR
ncbi:YihY/virulence factor BrkB family protein [Pseudonocardia lacus]|uniref:YihY/virulence factor BrkB family protein n=1 Tax=Pseudonocardia lacus TaxID=2835865 RepID=UPI00202917EF|nr:YihY/virulence factor BrkB family protein [Pseudonocardia lacus]